MGKQWSSPSPLKKFKMSELMTAEMVHAATFLKFTIIRVMIPETSNSVGVEFTVSSIGRKMADIPFDHFSGR